ncbi:DgyrCDS1676 [Dimorphilus gyrociliatus]|uniref:DgyrCDS1676 n=1 Tax=Dimorphilus gyrociliatus TaxID=2664684 RepID=A0A7I8VAV8_9ANNE|nr:DgyrCDS1676 [Dimorphilus gyrociliatus]
MLTTQRRKDAQRKGTKSQSRNDKKSPESEKKRTSRTVNKENREQELGEKARLEDERSERSRLNTSRKYESHLLPHDSQTFRSIIDTHRFDLIDHLVCNTSFLNNLSQFGFIERDEIVNFARYRDKTVQNTLLLEELQASHKKYGEESYSNFLECLRRSDQTQLAERLTNVEQEVKIVDEYQKILEEHLDSVDKYLSLESRRAQIAERIQPGAKVRATHLETSRHSDRNSLSEFLHKVGYTTKLTLHQFERCREVIDKLHRDCDEVAKTNAEMLYKLKECDEIISRSLPPHLREKKTGKELARITPRTPRSKRNEAELFMASIKYNMRKLKVKRPLNCILNELMQPIFQEDLHSQEVGRMQCEIIAGQMERDVKDRTQNLSKYTEPPPRDGRTVKYLLNVPEFTGTKPNELKKRLEDLAIALHYYTYHEGQLTHQMNITKYKRIISHRNFDKVDKDLKILQSQLKNNEKEKAIATASHIVDVTKSEREDCLKILNNIEKHVGSRKQKLYEAITDSKPIRRRKKSKNNQQGTDSNFSKRLAELDTEVGEYIDLEMTLGQRYRSELAHKTQDFSAKMRKKEKYIRDSERRLVALENDKDKYKRLYTNEKSLNVLQKPTLARKKDDLSTALMAYEEPRKETPPKRRPRRKNKVKEDKEKDDLLVERMTFKTRPKIARRVRKSIEKKEEEVREKESIVISLPSIDVN